MQLASFSVCMLKLEDNSQPSAKNSEEAEIWVGSMQDVSMFMYRSVHVPFQCSFVYKVMYILLYLVTFLAWDSLSLADY